MKIFPSFASPLWSPVSGDSLKSLLLASLSMLPFAAARSEGEPPAISIEAATYPHGLYSGKTPDHRRSTARSLGGYDVLSELHNVTGLRTAASQGTSSGEGYVFKNLRIASDQTTFEDYLIGYYTFDLGTQQLSPTRFERAPDVGIYEITDKILLKDTPDPINFYRDPATPGQFAQGGSHTFQSDTDYFVDLTVGQRLCIRLRNYPSNRLYRFVILMEDGTTFIDSRTNTGTSSTMIYSASPILVSGTYRFRLEAVSPATSFNFGIQFFNENGGTTTTVASGDTLSASLGGNAGGYGLPYRKFKVRLNSGQTLNLPSDYDTLTYLINEQGSIVGGGYNSGMNVTVTSTGDYYIIITPYDDLSSSSESYSGRLTITDSLSFRNWAWSHALAYGQDGAAQDADSDGLENLLEYALGMDPSRADGEPATRLAADGNQIKLTYNRPDYLQGVTVQPAFSTDLRIWSTVSPAEAGSADGVTRMEAVFPSGKQVFGHLHVTGNP